MGKRSADVPATLRSFFNTISILQLDTGSILHPNCYSGSPFNLEHSQFTASLVVCCVTVAMFSVNAFATAFVSVKVQAKLGVLCRFAMSGLAITYPMMANSALQMINCANGVVATDITTADSTEVVRTGLVLVANPLYECYKGDHFVVGGMAWAVLFMHVIGFPLATFVYLKRTVPVPAKQTKQWLAIWNNYVAGDFFPRYFWMSHVNLAVLLVLSLVLVFATAPTSSTQALAFVFTAAVVIFAGGVIVKLQPYVEKKRWKVPVKLMVLSVTLLSALVNIVYYGADSTGTGDAFATGLAYVLFVACLLLVIVFFVAFWRMIVESRAELQKAKDDKGSSDRKHSSGTGGDSAIAKTIGPGTNAIFKENPMSVSNDRAGGGGGSAAAAVAAKGDAVVKFEFGTTGARGTATFDAPVMIDNPMARQRVPRADAGRETTASMERTQSRCGTGRECNLQLLMPRSLSLLLRLRLLLLLLCFLDCY